jgi:regulator of sigma E protease
LIATILWGIVVLGVLVLAHELGHFLAAKKSGIKVHEFSIGFWPRVVGVRRGDTDYRISALPIGGYVKMAGMSYEDEDRTGAPDEFLSKPWHIRAFVALAGPGMNFVLAIVLCCIMGFVGYNVEDYPAVVGNIEDGSSAHELGFERGDAIVSVGGEPVATWRGFADVVWEREEGETLTLRITRDGVARSLQMTGAEARDMAGSTSPLNPPVIGAVMIGSPAYGAGLSEGDSIVAIDGAAIRDWEDLSGAISGNAGTPISLDVARSGGVFTVEVTPTRMDGNPESPGRIGISAPKADNYTIKLPVWESIKQGPRVALDLAGQIYKGLGTMVKMAVSDPGSVKNAIVGPIGIMQMSGSQAKKGAANLIYFGALVSVALMVFNLLPLPVLDGGHIMISAAEGLARRRLRPRVHILVHRVGMALLGALVILVLFNDVRRVVSRGFAVSRTQTEAQESGEEPAPEAR